MNRIIYLKPFGKDYLWGGDRLNRELNKNIPLSPLAETWECSTHKDGPSVCDGGMFSGQSFDRVISENPYLLGRRHEGLKELPILVKLIDAKKDLSVQVHPSDEYAKVNEAGQLGKTEMWYVLDAKPGSKLVYGFSHKMKPETVRNAALTGSLTKYLARVPVEADDLFYIEAGTVHAIGEGILLAEIQENSNLTYRLYDYDRVDKNGKKRELHLDKALEVANLSSSKEPRQPLRVLRYKVGEARELLCRCKYFQVERMILNSKDISVSYSADELSFKVLLCIGGNAMVQSEEGLREVKKGDCVFIPADSEEIKLCGEAQFLDITG